MQIKITDPDLALQEGEHIYLKKGEMAWASLDILASDGSTDHMSAILVFGSSQAEADERAKALYDAMHPSASRLGYPDPDKVIVARAIAALQEATENILLDRLLTKILLPGIKAAQHVLDEILRKLL